MKLFSTNMDQVLFWFLHLTLNCLIKRSFDQNLKLVSTCKITIFFLTWSEKCDIISGCVLFYMLEREGRVLEFFNHWFLLVLGFLRIKTNIVSDRTKVRGCDWWFYFDCRLVFSALVDDTSLILWFCSKLVETWAGSPHSTKGPKNPELNQNQFKNQKYIRSDQVVKCWKRIKSKDV